MKMKLKKKSSPVVQEPVDDAMDLSQFIELRTNAAASRANYTGIRVYFYGGVYLTSSLRQEIGKVEKATPMSKGDMMVLDFDATGNNAKTLNMYGQFSSRQVARLVKLRKGQYAEWEMKKTAKSVDGHRLAVFVISEAKVINKSSPLLVDHNNG